MKEILPKNIIKAIKKTIGKGPHQLHEPFFCGNEIKYLKKTIKDNYVSYVGNYVKKFENKIKKITGSKFVITIVNGTEALHIALKVLGIKKNDEVLVPALTFVGTVNPIIHSLAIPHFVDSEIKTLGINPLKLEDYLNKIIIMKGKLSINKFTKRTIRAIIPVHIFGHSCNIKEIIRIAKKFNLIVIEDAAEALGSFYQNKHLGTFGHVGCLSFNGNKIITTGGGGAVITNNAIVAKKIRHFSSTARVNHKWEYIHNQIGYNLRMPSLNAALGLAQIENLDKFINAKRMLFKKYLESFKNIKDISLFKEPINCKSNYWLQTLVLSKKKSFLKEEILKEGFNSKIYLRPVWKLISELKPYKFYPKMDLTGAKNIAKILINLPSSQSLILKK
jgi:aminotransferase in exopolysaccharide biosynthesis